MDLLALIAEQGWLVNNLYQSDDGTWRANIRRSGLNGSWFTDWAEASSLEACLEDCIAKMQEAEFAETAKASHTISEANEPKPIEANQLLLQLGLIKPKEPFKRRI